MNDALELHNYLHLPFKSPKEQEYIAFLWDAFEPNYTHGKHPLAFLARHMLTMSFVYFNIRQIKQAIPSEFENGLIGFARDEKILIAATSPFVFSAVNERTILRFLRLVAIKRESEPRFKSRGELLPKLYPGKVRLTWEANSA